MKYLVFKVFKTIFYLDYYKQKISEEIIAMKKINFWKNIAIIKFFFENIIKVIGTDICLR